MQVCPDSNYLLAFQSIYRKCCSSANLSAPDPAIPFYYPLAVLGRGQILPIIPPAPNAS
jgi:hypothetical protein